MDVPVISTPLRRKRGCLQMSSWDQLVMAWIKWCSRPCAPRTVDVVYWNALGLWCNQSCCTSCTPLSDAPSSRMSYHDGDAWSHVEGEKIHDSLSSGLVLVGNSLKTVTWPWQKVMDLDEAQATEQRFACEGVPRLWSTCTSRRSQMNVMLHSLGCRCSFPWLAVIWYWCESVVACLIAFSLSRWPSVLRVLCWWSPWLILSNNSPLITALLLLESSVDWCAKKLDDSCCWLSWRARILGWMGTCPVEVNRDADI